MLLCRAVALLLVASCAIASAAEPKALPSAPDPDFQFRKSKIYTLTPQVDVRRMRAPGSVGVSSTAASRSSGVRQEASLSFERSYHLHGAVTAFDQRQRFGQYFDFYWRAKRPADITVRFEYRLEKLRAFTQAQELKYPAAHGTCESEFRVVGDEYADDGAVLAWRCELITGGRVVAEKRSFLWD